MSDSQGGKANEHGGRNRDSVAALLLAHGFVEIGPLPCKARKDDALATFERYRLSHIERPENAFAADVETCFGIYGHPYAVNFLLQARGWPEPLALMSRTQNSSGSALEKLEYLFANLKERVSCRSLVILDGEAFTSQVYRRADEWSINTNGHIARVFRGLSEFRHWLTEGATYPIVPQQAMLPAC